MKFLIISDIHGNVGGIEKLQNEFARVDAVLCGGDFARFNFLETAEPTLDALSKRHTKIFSVIGNCDAKNFSAEVEKKICNIEKKCVEDFGLLFAGSGGGSIFTNTTPNERSEDDLLSDFSALEKKCANDEKAWARAILISHNPPARTLCDAVNENVHAGSEKLRAFVETHSPLLLVTGHIHEGRAIDKIGKTLVINSGALLDGFYATVSIEKNPNGFEITDAKLCEI